MAPVMGGKNGVETCDYDPALSGGLLSRLFVTTFDSDRAALDHHI